MRSKIGALPLLLVGFLLASCATPRGLDEPPLQIPTLKPGYGRVYFTRPGEFAGSAIQPEIRMNNEVVGRSVPGGFSYVDRPPGKYAVTTATEVENAVTFQLAAGETKYIKTAVTPGILVGHVTPTLEFPEQGQSAPQVRRPPILIPCAGPTKLSCRGSESAVSADFRFFTPARHCAACALKTLLRFGSAVSHKGRREGNAAHFPLKFGGRFSLKASTPSRRSSVGTMRL
jgi:hypothetical protein